jgi:hypothetical protein
MRVRQPCAAPECNSVSAKDTLLITPSYPFPKCYGTVGCGALAHPARLDYLPSAGTSLLDYKRGVLVARPRGGWEARRKKKPDKYL